MFQFRTYQRITVQNHIPTKNAFLKQGVVICSERTLQSEICNLVHSSKYVMTSQKTFQFWVWGETENFRIEILRRFCALISAHGNFISSFCSSFAPLFCAFRQNYSWQCHPVIIFAQSLVQKQLENS